MIDKFTLFRFALMEYHYQMYMQTLDVDYLSIYADIKYNLTK